MLPFAYWLLSLFKPASKYNTAPPYKTEKKLFTWLAYQRWLEMHTFCALVDSKRSPIADYKLTITGLITHLLAKNMNKCTHLATCSCWFDRKTNTSIHYHSCCKHSPLQSEWHRSIYVNGLFAYRDTAALIGYGAPVCVEYGPELCQLQRRNFLMQLRPWSPGKLEG